jgi:hypothetical protein
MLAVACAAWVICGWGAFKLTEKEPVAILRGWYWALWRCLRIGSLALLSVPFLVIRESMMDLPSLTIILPVTLAALVGGLTYFPYLALIAIRAKSTPLFCIAAFLTMLGGGAFVVSFFSEGRFFNGSLGELMHLPTIQFGSPWFGNQMVDRWRYHLLELSYGHEPGLPGVAVIVAFIGSGALHILMLIKLCTLLRSMRSRITSASSAP